MGADQRVLLLAELLRESPTEAAWEALLELIAGWPDGASRAQAIATADTALETWPDRLRAIVSDRRWLYRAQHLADVARLARAMTLYRREQQATPEVQAIAGSCHAEGLTTLSILRCDLDAGAWQALLRSTHLGGLRRLRIERCVLGETIIAELLQTTAFPQLRELRLHAIGLSAARLQPLVRALPFPQLRALSLCADALGDAGATLLARAPWLGQLQQLRLREAFITELGVAALLEATHEPGPRQLDVSGNRVAASARAGLFALAAQRGIALRL